MRLVLIEPHGPFTEGATYLTWFAYYAALNKQERPSSHS